MLGFLLSKFSGLLFLLELMTAEALFAFALPRRKRSGLRYVICMLLCALSMVWFPYATFSHVMVFIVCLIYFVITVFCCFLCFDAKFWDILFCTVAGYSVQHLSYQLRRIWWLAKIANPTVQMVYMMATWLLLDAIVFWLAYHFTARKLYRDGLPTQNYRMLTAIAACILFFTLVISGVASVGEENDYHIFADSLYGILCSVFSLLVLFVFIQQQQLEVDLKTVQSLLQEGKKQYAMSKENIEIINLKCHDLKYQIRSLRKGEGEVDKAALKEIEKAVLIYDSMMKTGNDTLDVLLTEKSLYCEKMGISFSCIADGEKLSFMSETDLYSLFGNAIDNAIDSVSGLLNPEDKLITIHIGSVGQIISIHIENKFAGELLFEDGLPVTTKDNPNYHGFGTRSMQVITDKYGGTMSINAENGIFSLNFLFPMVKDKFTN